MPCGCVYPSGSLLCSGSRTWFQPLLHSLTRLGTLAGGTFSWLLQASRFWSGGPRPISRSEEHQCSPSQKCRDIPQTQSLCTVSSLHLHLPLPWISLYSLTFISGIASRSQSPSCPEPCLLSYTPSASMSSSSPSTPYA